MDYVVELSKKYGNNCVVVSDTLRNCSDVKKLLTDTKSKLQNDGYIILTDIVTDVEDAYLNSFAFLQDNNHVRYYTVKEIISIANECDLYLQHYEQVEETSIYSGESYNSFIETLPERIVINHLKRGVFVLQSR